MNQEIQKATPSTDFTVTATGEAFISQRKLEEVLGLGTGTINKFLSRQHPQATVDKGLGVDLVISVSTYRNLFN